MILGFGSKIILKKISRRGTEKKRKDLDLENS
jgi:hypothetical protein